MKNPPKARKYTFLVVISILFGALALSTSSARSASEITFTAGELLGKPENDSITINIVPDTTIEYHYQYGTTTGGPYADTPDYTAEAGQPSEVTITGLTPNTQYFYRMQYHAPADGPADWVTREEHSFWTQRAKGSSFTFTVTSDSHAQMNTRHQQAMTNISTEHPDFNIDLGDTFYVDGTTSQAAVNAKYLAYRAPLYMGKISPSVPIFLASGNHEDEEGWNLDDTPFSIALGSVQARKLFFPTPIGDGFYSANTDILADINPTTYGDQYREDYYAWTWGDALFVVIDEFQYTMDLPYAPNTAGEGGDDAQTGDQWSWTLGAQQFQWFKETLENSDAKYKFVFSHNMLGGITRPISGVGAGYVRGGAEAAAYFEWGGNNADGTPGFEDHRDSGNFGTTPIHQLMLANGVSAYFHGHDHQYVYETRDGIVYQEVPSPSMTGSGFSGIYTVGDYGTYNTIAIFPNAGHLLITVDAEHATVDYISSNSTTPTVNYSYTIAPNTSEPKNILTTAVIPSSGGTVSPASGVHLCDEGEVVPISAVPNTGYHFVNWTGDMDTVDDVDAASTTITMDDDYSITANFAINIYSLTVNAGTGGTITNPATSPSMHNYGEVVNLTADPNPNYHFVNWTGDVSSVANVNAASTTITIHEDYTIMANFAVDVNYNLAVGNDGHGSVTLSPAGGTYLSGQIVTLTPVPSEGYHFSSWSGPDAADIINTAGVYTIVINEDKSITANFAINIYTLTVSNDGNGSVSRAPLGPTYNHGTTVTLTPVPNTNYQFLSWSGTNAADINYSAGVYTILMDGNKSIKANFIEIATYTLTASSSGNGSVTLNPTGGTYAVGTTVTLTPAPNANYHFVSWTGPNVGDIINTGGVYTIVMNGNKSVTANFAINTYTLTYAAGAGGSLTGDTSQTIDYGEDGTAVTAVPDAGYHFVNWSDTSTDNPRTDTNVTTNISVTANFAINTYTLTYAAGAGGSISGLTSQTVAYGQDGIAVIAIPDTGYHFVDWSDASTDNPRTDTNVTANISVIANFAINMHYVYLPITIR
jgi:hypothetical protein